MRMTSSVEIASGIMVDKWGGVRLSRRSLSNSGFAEDILHKKYPALFSAESFALHGKTFRRLRVDIKLELIGRKRAHGEPMLYSVYITQEVGKERLKCFGGFQSTTVPFKRVELIRS